MATTSSRRLRRQNATIILTPAEQAVADAMARSSPPPDPFSPSVLGRRARSPDGGDDGNTTKPDTGPYTASVGSSQASVGPPADAPSASVLRYASKKKLRPEQREEVEAFLQDTPSAQQAKLLTNLMALQNKLDAIRSAALPYELSENLKTNIASYCVAVLLSAHITAYKGDTPRGHVLDILKKYRFDLPPGIEYDYASWEKVATFVGHSLTQCRARLKKMIRDSLASSTNIFDLAQLIVHSTPCRPTNQLCARVALMRAIYAEYGGGEKYWNHIDARLEFIRSQAGPSVMKLNRAFNNVLKEDQAKYDTGGDYEIEETMVYEWQQRVDDVICGVL